MAEELPPIRAHRGGIRFPAVQSIDSDDEQRTAWQQQAADLQAGLPENQAMMAMGGFCAPMTMPDARYSFFNLAGHTWLRPDLPWCWDINVDAWLFPRLTRWEHRSSEARRRLRAAWSALRRPETIDDDPDEWQ